MDKYKFKASVILPVFNGEKTLADTLDSLVAQTFKDFELIACVDGTNDAAVHRYLSPFLSELHYKKEIILFQSIKSLFCSSVERDFVLRKASSL